MNDKKIITVFSTIFVSFLTFVVNEQRSYALNPEKVAAIYRSSCPRNCPKTSGQW